MMAATYGVNTMFPLALNVSLGLGVGPTVDLNTITVTDAASLHGQVVRAVLEVGQPVDTFGRWTIAGVEVAGVERGVRVPNGGGVWQGDTLTVVGVLAVVSHPAAVVNGVEVPAATEVRVVGLRAK